MANRNSAQSRISRSQSGNGSRHAAHRRAPGKATGVRRFPDIRACLRGSRSIPTIAEWERILLEESLRRFPTKTQAAAEIGLTRQGFGKKIDRMGIV